MADSPCTEKSFDEVASLAKHGGPYKMPRHANKARDLKSVFAKQRTF